MNRNRLACELEDKTYWQLASFIISENVVTGCSTGYTVF